MLLIMYILLFESFLKIEMQDQKSRQKISYKGEQEK